MTAISSDAPQRSLFRLVLTVFLPFAGGYFLSYLYRSTNAVIAPQLIDEVGLSAGDLGMITSAYFLAFAAAQVPLGLLLDRFGPRRVQATFLLFAALGAVLFAIGHSKEILAIARGLIGLGVAGGLMASFKAITLWFPERRWPLVNGCFMGMGGLGAVAATAPLEAALGYTDWRGVFLGLAAITVGVSAIIFLTVPEKEERPKRSSLYAQLEGLRHIYADRLFWRYAPLTITALAANMAIQSLWAGLWLKDIAGLERVDVANYLFVLTAAMTVGFVSNGVVADFLERWNVGLGKIVGWGMVVFLGSQAAITFELDPTGVWPWILFGLTMNIVVLAYPLLSRHFPLEYAGRVNTGLNVLAFSGVYIAQYGIGAIIDLWPPAADGSYLPEAYRAAFGTFLALQAVAFLWFLVPAKRKAMADDSR
ncbi:MAG: MFS transporter [Alphaproteobacteria bacterium]|nr:MFS transporter [Alphaproteobacteria bacterium]